MSTFLSTLGKAHCQYENIAKKYDRLQDKLKFLFLQHIGTIKEN